MNCKHCGRQLNQERDSYYGIVEKACKACREAQRLENIAIESAKARYNTSVGFVDYDGFANPSDALRFYNCD